MNNESIPTLREHAEALLAGNDFPQAIALLDQALARTSELAERGPWLELDLLAMLADALRLDARYRPAYQQARQALLLAERLQGSEHVELAPLLNCLGICCRYLALFQEGREHFRRAIRLLRRRRASPDELSADLYHNLAALEHAAGRPLCGERLARRGLGLRRRLQGENDPGLASDLCALGALLEEQARLDEAQQLFEQSLQIWEAQPQARPVEVACTLHALASLAARREQWSRAVRLYRRSVRLKRNHLGEQHASLGISLHNLAVARLEQGREARAESLLREALEIMEPALGPSHPQVEDCRATLECLAYATAC